MVAGSAKCEPDILTNISTTTELIARELKLNESKTVSLSPRAFQSEHMSETNSFKLLAIFKKHGKKTPKIIKICRYLAYTQ